ncbi:MAG: hypothetical protein U1E65_18370 [Myxococcota bacterium]
MPRLAWFALLSLFAACSKPTASCPAGTRLVGDHCAVVCVSDEICVAGETCQGGVCKAGARDAGLADSGLGKDADEPRDAGQGRDAEEAKDAVDVKDADPVDRGSPDADPTDTGTPDTGTPDGGTPDAGTPDAGRPTDCHGLDEASCRNEPNCTAWTCPLACGGTVFSQCLNEGEVGSCPAPPMCECARLDEQACQNAPDCQALFCPDCTGQTSFSLCYSNNGPQPVCGVLSCPCESATTLLGCEARPDCAPIYAPPLMGNCRCDAAQPDCCPRFDSCGTPPFQCDPTTATCPIPPPDCPTSMMPAVGSLGCWLGCVEGARCAP